MFWLQCRTEEISQGGHGGQVFTREKPLEMEYCQISTKVPLCGQKDFSSFPDLPYRCSPKLSLLALPGRQQRHWSREVSCRQSHTGRASLGRAVSAPCGHAPFQAHIPGPAMARWHVVSLLPEIPRICKSGAITQQAAKCQSFVPAHRGLQTSQPDSKRKAKPEHDSTESVCWTATFFLPRSLLNPGPEEQGCRLWANTPLSAALEIAWQWLRVILRVRWTKEIEWQGFDLASWTVQTSNSTHSSRHAKICLGQSPEIQSAWDKLCALKEN